MSGGDPSPVPPWLLEVDYPPGLLSVSEGGPMEGSMYPGGAATRIQDEGESTRPLAYEPLGPLPSPLYQAPAAAPAPAAAQPHLSAYPSDLHMAALPAGLAVPSLFHALPGPFSSSSSSSHHGGAHGQGPEWSSHVTHYRVAPQPAASLAYHPTHAQTRPPSPSPHLAYLPSSSSSSSSSSYGIARAAAAYSRPPAAAPHAPASSHFSLSLPQTVSRQQHHDQQQQHLSGHSQHINSPHDQDFLHFLGLQNMGTGLPEGHHQGAMAFLPPPAAYVPHPTPHPHPAYTPAHGGGYAAAPHTQQAGGAGEGLGGSAAYGLFQAPPPLGPQLSEASDMGGAYGDMRPSITSEEGSGEFEEEDMEEWDMEEGMGESSSDDDDDDDASRSRTRHTQQQAAQPASSPRDPDSPSSNASSTSSNTRARSNRRSRTYRPYAKKRSRKSELESLQAAVAASGGDPSELSLDSLLKPKPRNDGAKRGRGRPRTKAAIEVFIYDENGEPVRRRRGRPPKAQAVAFITSDGEKIPIPRPTTTTRMASGGSDSEMTHNTSAGEEEVMERRDSVDSTYSTATQEGEEDGDRKPRAMPVPVPVPDCDPPLLARDFEGQQGGGGSSMDLDHPLLFASGSSSSGLADDSLQAPLSHQQASGGHGGGAAKANAMQEEEEAQAEAQG